MRKIISILLVVIMLFGLLAVTSSAANIPTIKATANKNTVKVGDTVTVTVGTSASSKLCVVNLCLEYNTEYFEVTRKASAEAFSVEELIVSEGKVKFGAVVNSTIQDSATDFFTVDFKVLKTGGEIKLVVGEAYIVDGENDINITEQINGNTLAFSCAHFDTDTQVTKESTCTEFGTKTIICKECGATVGTERIPVAEHDFETPIVVKKATCTEKGLKEGKCKNCEATTREDIPIVDHEFGEWEEVTPATETQDGVKERKCTGCGKTEQGIIPKLGHKYNPVVTAPTCTEGGYTTYVCDCGDTYISDYTDALGHSDGDDDGCCDNCDEVLDPSKACDHNCHKKGIKGFFWKIVNFFNKLFGKKQYCECGVAHY